MREAKARQRRGGLRQAHHHGLSRPGVEDEALRLVESGVKHHAGPPTPFSRPLSAILRPESPRTAQPEIALCESPRGVSMRSPSQRRAGLRKRTLDACFTPESRHKWLWCGKSASDPGCVKTLTPSAFAQQSNPHGGVDESLLRRRSAS